MTHIRDGSLPGDHGSIPYWIVGDPLPGSSRERPPRDSGPLLVIHGGPGMPHTYLRDLDR